MDDAQSAVDAAHHLRAAVQQFVCSFGLLAGDQTPCGQPLAPSHAHALMLLASPEQRGARTSQQGLAYSLGIDKSSAARLCAKMERLGDIDQQRPPDDGRARLVGLTPQGRRVAERLDAASRARFQRVLEAMPSSRARKNVIAAMRDLNEVVAAVGRLESNA